VGTRAPVPTALYLDPRIGRWCFDAGPLMRAHECDPFLLQLMNGFRGRAHLVKDVLDEVQGAAGATIRIAGWCEHHVLTLADDLARYAELRLRWGSEPGRDRGEAASIVASRRNGWRLVIDERVGFQAAIDEGVTVTRTRNLLVSTVRAGWWQAEEAWRAYVNLLAFHERIGGYPRLGPSLWSSREEFLRLCATVSFDEPPNGAV
jgi:hypothetical protein